MLLKYGRVEIRRQKTSTPYAYHLKRQKIPATKVHQVKRGEETCALISIQIQMFNKMGMGDQQWRFALLIRCLVETSDLPHFYDGCREKFSITHALNYKKGGLVTTWKDQLRNGVANLERKALVPSHVKYEPLIYTGSVI